MKLLNSFSPYLPNILYSYYPLVLLYLSRIFKLSSYFPIISFSYCTPSNSTYYEVMNLSIYLLIYFREVISKQI